MKRLIVDLDGTLCHTDDGDYRNSIPDLAMIEQLRVYKSMGFEIVIHTSRNMRTFEGSIGKINARTLPIILGWLHRNEVPYDEIIMGKPWCGTDGFYVDDRALRPAEFLKLSYEEVRHLLGMKP